MTATVSGEGTTELELEGDEPTYRAVLEALELSPQEATVVVDGQPVPEDRPIERESVTVVRLIAGG